MEKLKKILLIENNAKKAEEVISEFSKRGISVTHVESLEGLEKIIDSLSEFQIVILDWFLDEESVNSLTAQICLRKIREKHFIPVIIWSAEIDVFNSERDDIYTFFPDSFLKSIEKIDADELFRIIELWFHEPVMRLSGSLRNSVLKSLESTLYDVADRSLGDMEGGLKALICIGEDNDFLDSDHAVNVLLRLIGRNIQNDVSFIAELTDIVAGINSDGDSTNEDSDKDQGKTIPSIQDLFMYYKPSGDMVRTGDIVKIKIFDFEVRAIVLTPLCDLARPKKTKYLRLSIVREAKNRKERKGELLSKKVIKENGKINVVCYDQILDLRDETLVKDQTNHSVMRYIHTFKTITGQDVEISREKRLDDPFRSDLLHNFVSYAGRIGEPFD